MLIHISLLFEFKVPPRIFTQQPFPFHPCCKLSGLLYLTKAAVIDFSCGIGVERIEASSKIFFDCIVSQPYDLTFLTDDDKASAN